MDAEDFMPRKKIFSQIDGQQLRFRISELLKRQYLSEVKQFTVGTSFKGFIYGEYMRPFISIPTKIAACPDAPWKWVHYLVDSGSPVTFVSRHVTDNLINKTNVLSYSNNYYKLNIGGYEIRCGEGPWEYSRINLIGQDFLEKHKLILVNDPASGTCEIIADMNKWLKEKKFAE